MTKQMAGRQMNISRRGFGLGLMALGLGACSGGGTSTSLPRTAGGLPADLRPVPNAAYDAWVAGFRQRASAAGINNSTLNTAFRGAGYLPGVIKRDRNQTEFKRSLEDYLSIAASDERVSKGRAAYARHRSTLNALEQTYGVDAEIITAIWGLESFFGERRGDVPVISATSTLAFDGRRGAFFEKQLIAALKILQNGDISAARMTGSWAGAMGHTQFIPTSYQAFAVDFTGDGRRDIWSEDPSDALASTAAYLARNGWTRGLRWGREVTGTAAVSGTLIQPQAGGPKFAVTSNFRAIKRYNNSDAYAIGVGHLADRIGGGGPLRSSFPPDANGLTKDDRILLQKRLTAKGFDTGGADGVIGPNSETAIRAYQQSRGLPATGTPSPALLRELG
ncbi:putative lytic murein transglycosylase (plasmid) [Phaeobacter inhibens]|nr:putative lytic murein transglycosylase [Phaeobacter inhibens]AUQ80590.1 putative lytic murein transglycosylase [Phaeobacter inhibens]AUR17749.1 putative lytic murein transglycosylase [Phaeobacter inhibens]